MESIIMDEFDSGILIRPNPEKTLISSVRLDVTSCGRLFPNIKIGALPRERAKPKIVPIINKTTRAPANDRSTVYIVPDILLLS